MIRLATRLRYSVNTAKATNDETDILLYATIAEVGKIQQAVSSDRSKELLLLIAELLSLIKDTMKDKERFRGVIFQCISLGRVLQQAYSTNSQTQEKALPTSTYQDLKDLIVRITEDITKGRRQQFWPRISFNSINQTKVGEWVVDFSRIVSILSASRSSDTTVATPSQSAPNWVDDTNLPPRPQVFFGRTDTVKDVVKNLLAPERPHVFLCGPGGIGKSTIAEVVLHEPEIVARYKERRFLIRFDDVFSSQMTFALFIRRLSRALHVSTSSFTGYQDVAQYLCLGETLLVLDCVEALIDPGVSTHARIANAIAHLGDLRGVAIMLICTLNELPSGLMLPCTVIHVPPLLVDATKKTFSSVYQANSTLPILEWLSSVGINNAMSVNLLARVVHTNKWTVEELRDAWRTRSGRLVEGVSDSQSQFLACSVEVSLNAPSTKAFRGDARRALAILALLPQGLSCEPIRVVGAFMELPDPIGIVEVLCKHGLLFLRGGFYKMNICIRQYMCSAVPPDRLDSALLKQVRRQYPYLYTKGQSASALMTLEDNNAESLVVFELTNLSLPEVDLKTASENVARFLGALLKHNPRTTCLREIMPRLADRLLQENRDSEPEARHDLGPFMKAFTVISAYHLAICDYAASVNLFEIAHNLALAQGEVTIALECLSHKADALRMLGQYRTAREVIAEARLSDHWAYGSLAKKGFAAWVFKMSELQMEAKPDGPLFTESCEYFKDATGMSFSQHVSTALGAFTVGAVEGNWLAARTQLLELLASEVSETDQGPYLYTLAPIAFVEGQFDQAQEYLRRARECYMEKNDIVQANRMLGEQALIAAHRREFEEARQLLHQAGMEQEKSSRLARQNDGLALYAIACLSLFMDARVEAKVNFERVRDSCTERQELHLRAQSIRALGEIALMDKDNAGSNSHFGTTQALCETMGVPPALLYRCHPLRNLGDKFRGWKTFLGKHALDS